MPPRRSCRAGFTLLEVVLALTLTAVAATVAGVALQAARQAASRVATFRDHGEPAQQLHDALHDLLRHAPPAGQVDEALFVLRRGAAADTLVFLSRGVQQPFGTGAIWRVHLYSDSTGLWLRAEPVHASGAASESGTPPVTWHVPAATDFSVSLASFEGRGLVWRRDWPLERARPAGLRLSWRGPDDQPVEQVLSLLPLAEATP